VDGLRGAGEHARDEASSGVRHGSEGFVDIERGLAGC